MRRTKVRQRAAQLDLASAPHAEPDNDAPSRLVPRNLGGACIRCGSEPAPLFRCLATFEYHAPSQPAYPTSRSQIASFILCDKCTFTLVNCLERGTKMTPIVPGGATDLAPCGHSPGVSICAECWRKHG